MKQGFDRTERVGDLIQQALAQILMQDMTDERFRLVTITGVTVSRDLSYAKVYVSILLDEIEQIKQVINALNANVKAFRYSLAQAVKLRNTPELKFVYDDSIASGARISSLIDSAMKKTEK